MKLRGSHIHVRVTESTVHGDKGVLHTMYTQPSLDLLHMELKGSHICITQSTVHGTKGE